jgi:hypothetical protein
MNILDGQHSFKNRVELGLPIYYQIAKKMTIMDVASFNDDRSKWIIRDYADSFAAAGNRHYKKLMKFVDQFSGNNMAVEVGAIILLGNRSECSIKSVKRGTFIFPDNKRFIADANMVQDITCHYGMPFQRSLSQTFMRFVQHIKGYDHDRMMNQLKNHKSVLVTTQVDMAHELERVYNMNIHRTSKNYTPFYSLSTAQRRKLNGVQPGVTERAGKTVAQKSLLIQVEM